VIAHELAETASDPESNAWYDDHKPLGWENGDKCEGNFGTDVSTADNGSVYNVQLGGLNFLLQQNWVNADGGYCALKA
jgi:Phosphate-induced protein 1 conserved region